MVYKRNPAILASAVGAETLALDESGGKYYTLNETASAIWQGLQTERNLDELCSYLTGLYDVDAKSIEQDTQVLLNRLVAEGLVVASNGNPA